VTEKKQEPTEDADLRFLRLQFEEYADGSKDARELAEKCRDYFDGNQLTEAERQTLKKRGQPAIVDNKIRDKVETLLGIEKQQRTDPKAFPRTPQDESASEVATDTLRYIADASQYHESTRKPAANNLIIEGLCAGQVIVERRKGAPPKICMEHIRWDRVFYDIRSLKDDFSDKNYCGYFTWMDADDVLDMWEGAGSVIEQSEAAMSGESETGTDKSMDDKPRYVMSVRERKRIQVFSHYFKRKGKWHFATWCRGGFLDRPKVSTYRNEDGEPDCCIELQALYRDSEGNPYGSVSRSLDLQDEHNKRRSKTLHLLTTKQLIAQKGAFDDINKTRAELHKSDGVLEPNPGFEWEIQTNLDLAQSQFQMLQYTDQQLSQIGPNAALAGTSGSISGIAKARDQQAGQLPISPLFDALDFWEMRMYRHCWNRARQFWKSEMFIRITDDQEKVKFIGLNKATTQGEYLVEKAKADPQYQQLDPQEQAGIVQEIANHPDARQPYKANEIARMDMDIIIERGQDVVNVQQEEFAMLAEIAKGRPEIPFDILLDLSQIRSETKKRVLDKMSGANDPMKAQMAQLQMQMQQMQAALMEANVRKTNAQAAQAEAATVESQVDASVKVAEFTTPQADPVAGQQPGKPGAAKTSVSVN
jgi:hypothetical protein